MARPVFSASAICSCWTRARFCSSGRASQEEMAAWGKEAKGGGWAGLSTFQGEMAAWGKEAKSGVCV